MGQDPSESHLDLLKVKITLSNSELYELAYNHQKFMHTVRNFNNEAKNKIDFEIHQQAMLYLAEAERVLEYAASCGKNIDRNLIICVLHNEACCYQKSWDLQKCSNYLEALIYNFQCPSDTVQTSPRSQESRFKEDEHYPEELQINELMKKPWSHRLHLCKYELQFCAINSQLRNHKSALVSGRRSIQFIKSIFRELQKIGQQYYLPFDQKDSIRDPLIQEPFEDFQVKMKIIEGICSIDDTPNVDCLEEYLITAKYYLSKWNIRKLQIRSESVKQSLRNFSIGSVMQLKPLSFEQNRQSTIDIQKWLENAYQQKSQTQILKSQTYEKIINKVLLLSMGYFTIATQMRLLSNEKHRKSEEAKRESRQYKQSQIYHLISIIMSCIYVPYDMLYMRHILASFNNHYPTPLDSSCSLPTDERVLKNNFDAMRLSKERVRLSEEHVRLSEERVRLSEEREKKRNSSNMDNVYEKSIRISETNPINDYSSKKSNRINRKDSKETKLRNSLKLKIKEQKNISKEHKNSENNKKKKELVLGQKRIRCESSLTKSIKVRKSKGKQVSNSVVDLRSRSSLKSSGKIKEAREDGNKDDGNKDDGNQYFDNIKKKAAMGRAKKVKSKEKKSKEKNTGQIKKIIDKYYF